VTRCPRCGDINELPRCGCDDFPEPRPHPPEADYCAGGGHAYHGDDAGMGRCYCGQRTYPAGGPTTPDQPADATVPDHGQ
jgi:hypothetical protein